MPTCPCGSVMWPDDLADAAFAGLITEADVTRPEWTEMCRCNGWDDAIVRKGAAAKAYNARRLQVHEDGDGRFVRRVRGAAHCVFPGCGMWVADGADHCRHGHPQSEDASSSAEVESDACPF